MAGIRRLVESTDDLFIIFVDGRFINWEGSKLSDDGSREYIETLDNVFLIDAPDMIEHQSRNKYIEKAQKMGFDYCLVIDSDEYIKYLDLAQFDHDLKLGNNNFTHTMIQDGNDTYPYYKLYTSRARYRGTHQQMYLDEKQIFEQGSRIVSGLITNHEKSLRSQERERYREMYYVSNPVR